MLEFVLLQASSSGGNFSFIITMVVVMVVFYFFMVLPQQRKQKQQQKFKDEVKKGDEVITVGGIHGKVCEVENETVIVQVDKSTKITFDKSSISMEATQRLQK